MQCIAAFDAIPDYVSAMTDPDFNLLGALDVLLAEGSVVGAARVLGLSDSAMSRTLSRLRAATGDPLLVRAGRGLVPTPHAIALRERVRGLADEVKAVLHPAAESLDVSGLEREFTIRANEGFVEVFAARLVGAVTAVAPGVRLRFAPKADKDVRPLREGWVDLDIGVVGGVPGVSGPEMRVQALFVDHFVGVVRSGHPLASGAMTLARYAACRHVVASRRGRSFGPVDAALAEMGLSRRVVVVVPSFPAALAVAATSDLVGLVTHSFLQAEQARDGGRLHWFALPVATQPITVSLMWHPRAQADGAHRWLRELVLATCRAPLLDGAEGEALDQLLLAEPAEDEDRRDGHGAGGR